MASKPRVTQVVPKTATNPTQNANFTAPNTTSTALAQVEADATAHTLKQFGL